jgi:DMSO/TMAO reductase YedYZ molybdopterin-dependent catalytic subunit
MSISMDDLVSMPSVTVPVMLVCAGNRRKEENMLKKSIGFNWGPCAAATSHWTGVRLGDLLRRAGVKQGARHVCFRGPTGELPKVRGPGRGCRATLPHACQAPVPLAYARGAPAGRAWLPAAAR